MDTLLQEATTEEIAEELHRRHGDVVVLVREKDIGNNGDMEACHCFSKGSVFAAIGMLVDTSRRMIESSLPPNRVRGSKFQ